MTEASPVFNQQRRDLLLSESTHDQQVAYYNKNRDRFYKRLSDESYGINDRASMSWHLSLTRFEHVLLEYSGGRSLDDVQYLSTIAFKELKRHSDDFPFKVIRYWEPDGYQFLLWALGLAVLSGNTSGLLTIARLTGKNPLGGDDKAIAQLYTRAGIQGLPREDSLIFEQTYSEFYNAIKGDGTSPTKAERQTSIGAYLKNWYQGMKDCYWHNRHKGRHATHFGYWSLESAAATVLFDLDDSSYRKSLYYPKDWVDYAREKGVGSLFTPEKLPYHHIALPNDEAPVSAEWVSNLSNDVITLNAGERFDGLATNENGDAIIWISR